MIDKLRSAIALARVILSGGDSDWTGMFAVWSVKFDRMAALFSRHGQHPDSGEQAEILRECARISATLSRHGYFGDAMGRLCPPHFSAPRGEALAKAVHDEAEAAESADLERLLSLIRDNYHRWWN